MFRYLIIAADVFSLQNIFFQKFHLAFQTGRKNGKSHYLDQSDVFFLDVVKFCMGMVNAQRMLLSCDVVSESQIQLVQSVFHACDRSDRIMRRSVRLSIDKCVLIGVSAPFAEDVISKVDDALCILPAQADN